MNNVGISIFATAGSNLCKEQINQSITLLIFYWNVDGACAPVKQAINLYCYNITSNITALPTLDRIHHYFP